MGYDRKEAMRIVLGTMRNAPLESICLGDFRKLHRQGRACLHVGTGQPMADIHGSGIVDVRLEDAEYLKGYVNVYRISREFGGHEEGGWWYDWYEFETCIHCLLTEMDEVALFLERFYGDPPGNPPLHSVLSNGEWCIYKELDKAESQSKSRPHYE